MARLLRICQLKKPWTNSSGTPISPGQEVGMNIILGRKPQKQSKQQPKAKVKKKNAHGKYTISGYIKNENGEPLVNATIYDKEEKQGTLTK
jgi:hypothetical protein